MYHYVVHNGSAPSVEFLESISEFSHLLIWGLIKGLNLNQAIFSACSIDVHYYIVHSEAFTKIRDVESNFYN